ncbi:MAG: DUF4298 domain-containing protein [Bacteroidaceae bacterium]|nr:DUF4298 domain-containing protein [Bacteroidaceae bacterium]
MTEKMTQIERIRHMEQLYDLATEAMKEQPMSASTHAKAQEAMAELAAYYGSDEWKQDFADDEAGLLPKDLKRGVLSEDGLWNLFTIPQRSESRVKLA